MKRRDIKIFILFLFIVSATACNRQTATNILDKDSSFIPDSLQYTLVERQDVYMPTFKSDGKKGKPKNIILLIGDGMGLAHIAITETANRGELSILNMKNIGFIKTFSANNYTTDSAAAGSAFATGEKTNNGSISHSPEGKDVKNTAEILSVKGRKIGVISTGNIADATPGTQYGHALNRKSYEDIVYCLLNDNVDVVVGSNRKSFVERKDGIDLFAKLKELNYSIIDNSDDISNSGDKVICIDEKFGKWANETNLDFLAKTTKDAIKKLDNKNGFYMMIESAKIDHAAHANNARGVILETLLFDAAVAEALRFADEDENTLVIVTADHETGGLTVMDGDYEKGYVEVKFSTKHHTGLFVPVYAYGVGADEFRGVYDNTDIFNKICNLLK